ncbi:hypothetical protein Taro_050272 [Colocasia esculenta]|uniref:Uncharacterized protein n=1 Tax=Colocasia esculenta TaxID=4460 RepID=A0A843XDD6_COLES|nr:hypothetical protein [Colocasia esculenta]
MDRILARELPTRDHTQGAPVLRTYVNSSSTQQQDHDDLLRLEDPTDLRERASPSCWFSSFLRSDGLFKRREGGGEGPGTRQLRAFGGEQREERLPLLPPAAQVMAKGSGSVQALYELCRKTFGPSGATASPQAIRKLSALMGSLDYPVHPSFGVHTFLFIVCMAWTGASKAPTSANYFAMETVADTIGPEDVGLSGTNLDDERGHGFFGRENLYSSRTARWALPITYLHIYECESFTIGPNLKLNKVKAPYFVLLLHFQKRKQRKTENKRENARK